jgi:hypothetical protein
VRRRRRRKPGNKKVARLRCCGRFAYWRTRPLDGRHGAVGITWQLFMGEWACTECARRLEGPPPRYVVDALAAALAELPPLGVAELREIGRVFGFEVAAR